MSKQEDAWRKACQTLADATDIRMQADAHRSQCIRSLTIAEKACREAVEAERVAQRDLGIATEVMIESREV